MKFACFLFCLVLFVGCGKSKSDSHVASGGAGKEVTNQEIKQETSSIELSSDEELVLTYLKENKDYDMVNIGYELGKRLKRDIKNLEALLKVVELSKYDLKIEENETLLKQEIKKI